MILDKKRDVLFVPFSYNYTNENYKQEEDYGKKSSGNFLWKEDE